MKSKIGSLLCAATFGVMALSSSSAFAASFRFTQGGYSDGGVITGAFDATDLNNNGAISSFDGEVTGFSLSFSGNAIVGSFNHSLSDLRGLVYDLGSGFIGDGATGAVEGLASNWFGASGFDFASGLGPTGVFGGRVIDIASGASSSTRELIAVTAVPEPETYAMLLAGLGLLGGLARRRQQKR